jgi:N-acetyl-alpha-D-muramate 1-phosphate uridylyltransferase
MSARPHTARHTPLHTAMILAAGLGTRMRQLAADLPKPLVPVAGKPLIDHVLERLDAAGIRRIIVNVHHLAEPLIAHLATRARPEIAISDERGALLDSGGGVRKALALIGPDPFVIHNCDSIWTEGTATNLGRLLAHWDEDAMDCLLLLAPTVASLGYHGRGDFALDAAGRLRRPAEREIVPFAFAGVSIAHPRFLDAMPEGPFSLNRPWDRAIEAGRAFGVRLEGRWMHVGDPAAIAAAEDWIAHAHER